MNSSWFSHDSNARNSKKLIRLRQKLGAVGYGTYWMLLERLREEENYTSERDYAMIAFDLRVDEDTIRSVVEDFGLFEVSEDGKYFHAPGLDERMSAKDVRANAGRKGAESKWGKKDATPSGMAQNGETMANENLPYGKTMANENLPYGIREEKSRVEESKEKEIQEKENYYCSSSEQFSEEQQQQFFLSQIFFKNWGKPQEELRKFINYNNTGDRCWSRMSFEQRQSAFEFWKQTPATPPRMGEKGLALWHEVFNTLVAIRAPAAALRDALADDVDVKFGEGKILITCTKSLQDYFDANAQHFRPIFIPPDAPDRRVGYKLPQRC